MAIIGIGICIGENLLLGIGIGLVGIFLYWWNPSEIRHNCASLNLQYKEYNV